MNTLKHSILSIGSGDMTHDEYQKHLRNIKSVLGHDAALAFGDSIATEADQFFVEEPEQLPMLWKRMMNLAKSEGKV
jgi:hypothetical protein